jgi:predicted nucleic acid-binding protein
MPAVTDTSPINYLVQIGEIDLLRDLFGRVLIPQAVFCELTHAKTSLKVRDWVTDLPAWVEVRLLDSVTNSALLRLDIGEREAIQLALDTGIGTVLLDETDARHEAAKLNLEVRGTLGILERAARLGKIDFRPAFSKLERTNFRISAAVRTAFLMRNP